METLRERYEKLQDDVLKKYKELVAKGEYDFTKSVLDNYDGKEKEEVAELLENGDYNELYEYDFQEFLEQVFYNDRRGEEKMCYLLSATEKEGLYVLDNETSNTFFIGFNDLNELNSKITVIEEIISLVG